MDVKKIVIDELTQAGGTLHGESNFKEAKTLWERALLLALASDLQEQALVLEKLILGVDSQTESTTEHKPVPENEMKTFDDIIGATREKSEIVREFMRHHKYPNLYVQGKAMLMYGPPGTGKTMIAKGIASAFNQPQLFPGKVHLFGASGADLKGKYYGETEKNIKSWFVSAQEMAKKHDSISILFLDEFESLAPNRQGPMASSAGSSSLTALLQFIDGMAAFDRVILLAATNGPWELDSAVLRRFTSKLFVDLPSDETRRELISKLIGKRLNIDFSAPMYDKFSTVIAGLMGASVGITQYTEVDKFISEDKRQMTRNGIHLLGYSLSDVTHAVNSALNMLSELMIVQPQKDANGVTCYFELPTECTACVECKHRNGADLYLTLENLSVHGGKIFTKAIQLYPSSVNVAEYDKFIRYYKNPNQFNANDRRMRE
jgi:SpoVK/Ycf46/Vps4 family AAA+-type ATPase